MALINNDGFTYFEITVVLALMVILIAATVPRLINSYIYGADNTKDDAQDIVNLFSVAQSNAASNKANDHWGIRLVDDGTTDCSSTTVKDCVVMYKGKAFASRDTSYDQIFTLRNANYFTNLSDIDFFFNKRTGFANGLYGLPGGAVVYYPFTASTTIDISSRGNDSTTTEALTSVSNSCASDSSCFSYDGSSSFMDLPNTVLGAQNTTGFTFAAWVTVNDASDRAIVGGAPNNTYAGYASGGIWLSSGKPTATVFSSAPSANWYNAQSGSAISTGVWHHIVGTYDAITKYLTLYVDGSQSSQVTYIDPSATIAQDMSVGYIGRSSEAASPRWFNGSIDDVLIYDRPLSANEVSQIYLTTKRTTITASERTNSTFAIANGFATSTVIIDGNGHAELVSGKG